MSKNKYSKSRLGQVCKCIIPIFLLIGVGVVIANFFGKDGTITKMFFKNIVFTPHNIVGIILFIFFLGGTWVGKGKSKIIFGIVSGVMTVNKLYKFYEFLTSDTFTKIFNIASIVAIVSIMLLILCSVTILIIMFVKDKKEEKRIEAFAKRNSHVSNEEIIKQVNTGLEDRKKALSLINKDADVNSNNKTTQDIISKSEYCFHEIPKNNDDWKIANKRCPQCGAKLVSRTNSYDGTHFLGCANYGRTGCDFTINYHEYHLIRERIGVSK